MTKRWIGRWMMAVGVLHLPIALVKHHATWTEIAQAGTFDAVAGHAARGHATWFLIAGPSLLFLGAVLDALEKARLRPPLALGLAMLFMVSGMLVLMPRSGTWLLLAPAIALIWRARSPITAEW